VADKAVDFKLIFDVNIMRAKEREEIHV